MPYAVYIMIVYIFNFANSVIRIVVTFLLFYICSLQKYVREQILLAVAVIVKRGSLDKSIDCKSIFHEVNQLISSGNPTVVSSNNAYSYF